MARSTLLISMLALCLCGCGNPGAAEDDWVDFPDGKDDSITPQGDLGYLVVKQPDLPAGATVAPYRVSYRGTILEVGKKYRLKKGDGALNLADLSGGYTGLTESVTVEPKKTLTYEIPFVVVAWDPAALEVDVGPKPQVRFEARPSRQLVNSHYLDASTTSPRAFAFLQGSYAAVITPAVLGVETLGANATSTLELPLGTVKTIQVTADVRAKVTFNPPVREAADPSGAKACYQLSSTQSIDCQLGHHWIVWRRQGVQGSYEPAYLPDELAKVGPSGEFNPGTVYNQREIRNLYHFSLAAGSPVTVRMYTIPGDDPIRSYLYVVNNVPTWFNPAAGPSTIEGQHLDVFDAEVEENGAVSSFPATYGIEWLCPGGMAYWWCSTPGAYYPAALLAAGPQLPNGTVAQPFQFASPSGLDLPPGTYRITVKFTTDVGRLERIYQCQLITPSVAGETRCSLISER